jgi:hypothetical protein
VPGARATLPVAAWPPGPIHAGPPTPRRGPRWARFVGALRAPCGPPLARAPNPGPGPGPKGSRSGPGEIDSLAMRLRVFSPGVLAALLFLACSKGGDAPESARVEPIAPLKDWASVAPRESGPSTAADTTAGLGNSLTDMRRPATTVRRLRHAGVPRARRPPQAARRPPRPDPRRRAPAMGSTTRSPRTRCS